jgi:hypothetical protein
MYQSHGDFADGAAGANRVTSFPIVPPGICRCPFGQPRRPRAERRIARARPSDHSTDPPVRTPRFERAERAFRLSVNPSIRLREACR